MTLRLIIFLSAMPAVSFASSFQVETSDTNTLPTASAAVTTTSYWPAHSYQVDSLTPANSVPTNPASWSITSGLYATPQAVEDDGAKNPASPQTANADEAKNHPSTNNEEPPSRPGIVLNGADADIQTAFKKVDAENKKAKKEASRKRSEELKEARREARRRRSNLFLIDLKRESRSIWRKK